MKKQVVLTDRREHVVQQHQCYGQRRTANSTATYVQKDAVVAFVEQDLHDGVQDLAVHDARRAANDSATDRLPHAERHGLAQHAIHLEVEAQHATGQPADEVALELREEQPEDQKEPRNRLPHDIYW